MQSTLTFIRPTKIVILIATLMLVGVSLSHAQPFPHAQPIQELRSGILVDAQEGICFAMALEGIDAIQIATGAPLWHSDDAVKPLALQGKQLIAQATATDFGKLQLVVLDAETGSLLRPASIELPSRVLAHVTDTVGSSFDIWAVPTQDANAEVQLAWRFEHRTVQGIAPADTPPPATTESGTFLFNPSTGTSTQLAESIERVQDPLLVAESQRLPNVTGRQFHEQNRQHILVSEKNTAEGLWNKYQWTIYSKEGQRLGALDTFISFTKFIVHDSLLLFETPPFSQMKDNQEFASGAMLHAVALTNGVEQWSKPLRETTYRGAFPP